MEKYVVTVFMYHQETELNIIDNMSLTSPIPKNIREELSNDIFMSKCCLKDWMCAGRIEWHHNLIYAGKRVNERWCILPVCYHHHRLESQFKKELNKIMVQRATYEELSNYSKAIDYCKLKKEYE